MKDCSASKQLCNGALQREFSHTIQEMPSVLLQLPDLNVVSPPGHKATCRQRNYPNPLALRVYQLAFLVVLWLGQGNQVGSADDPVAHVPYCLIQVGGDIGV
ncbi:hypothetical protein NDU88_010408 [Pleurodeles waltl]|uniref:Uncharacterized protein n=1 Tax=Pleurodeles waltl TaxID=8319 RepID=A0AAV7Q008_PLEWA|nr:hypothetical protein NDU88_010408 [Pleurodeles waltl]